MYLKENMVRIIIIFMVILFAGAVFLTITFFKKEINLATNPSPETIKSNVSSFDFETYKAVLKKISP